MRKIVASLGLIAYLLVYVVIAVTIGSMTASWPGWAQIIYFAIAGTIWIIPIKFLFGWMNSSPEA